MVVSNGSYCCQMIVYLESFLLVSPHRYVDPFQVLSWELSSSNKSEQLVDHQKNNSWCADVLRRVSRSFSSIFIHKYTYMSSYLWYKTTVEKRKPHIVGTEASFFAPAVRRIFHRLPQHRIHLAPIITMSNLTVHISTACTASLQTK